MKSRSLLLAVALAPWAVVPILAVSGLGTSDAGWSSDLGWCLFLGVTVGVPLAYAGMLCIGLPSYLAVRRLKAAWPLLYLLSALVPFFLFLSAHRWGDGFAAAACGLAVALMARWLLSSGKGSAS